ncbi:hypothetical protein [Culicoidibacter larvae]|uniref:Uncharacterized protein n=1 Tax=Culicoidibacter larvae TaxID=2579976 RepID=A0A5R8QH86_9FIRM|nr:hypothetical protein [Culicoidibacter larvae]TLG77385.1 hypothetical protein FEZ08_01840 [Culicoidibacter larvae]
MTKTLKGMTLALGLATLPMLLGLVVMILTGWTWIDTDKGLEKIIVGGLALIVISFVLFVLFIWLIADTVYAIVVLVRASTESSVGGIVSTIITLVYNAVVFACVIIFFMIFDYGIEICMVLLVLGVATMLMNIIVSLASVEQSLLENEKTPTF